MTHSKSCKRILLVGAWQWNIYEQALSEGLKANCCEVIPFAFKDYIPYSSIRGYLQQKLLMGPDIIRLNKSLVQAVQSHRPDIVFLNRAIFIGAQTVTQIKQFSNSIIITYNNDNPFAYRKWSLWRHYLDSIKISEVNFFYRPLNVTDAQLKGIPNPQLLLPYYVEGLHRPISNIPDNFRSEIVFVGHYEPDGRANILEYLVEQGIPLRIFGTGWNDLPKHSKLRRQTIYPVYEEDYVKAITGAKIALVFLSKYNNDTYTRRCFEIPACGTLMAAPRTKDLKQFFVEDHEAIFFSSKEELFEKVMFYLSHSPMREQMAAAGRKRVQKDQHNNRGRCLQILEAAEHIEKQ
jgi:spore maturation protein CgeB